MLCVGKSDMSIPMSQRPGFLNWENDLMYVQWDLENRFDEPHHSRLLEARTKKSASGVTAEVVSMQELILSRLHAEPAPRIDDLWDDQRCGPSVLPPWSGLFAPRGARDMFVASELGVYYAEPLVVVASMPDWNLTVWRVGNTHRVLRDVWRIVIRMARLGLCKLALDEFLDSYRSQ